MIVGTTEIKTPAENPEAYSASWRHEIARVSESAILGAGLRIPYDDLIARQRRYLSQVGRPEMSRHITNMMFNQHDDSIDKSIIVANRVFGSTGTSQTKDQIEAMLLCPELNYDHICRCFNLTQHQISIYEKLFYNVREVNGTALNAQGVRFFFAHRGAAGATSPADQPGHWRAIAFEKGAAALITFWGWRDKYVAEEYNYLDIQGHIMPMLYRIYEKRLRFDNMDSKAVAETLGNVTKQFADLQRDGILSNNDRVSIDSLFSKVLGMAGTPKRALPDAAQQVRMQEALDVKRKQIADSATSGIKAANESLSNITRQIKEIDNARQQ
jgi:hypothetical protein